MRRLFATVVSVLAVAVATTASADVKWQDNVNANGKDLYGPSAPDRSTSVMRRDDVAVGTGYLYSNGLGVVPIVSVSSIPIGDITGAVPATRTITTTAPLRIDGGGSADLSGNRTLSVSANGITDAFIRQGAAVSVIGNPTGSTANVQDVTASGANQFLGTNGAGTALTWTSAIPAASVSLTSTYIGHGSGTNALTGEQAFTFTPGTRTMVVGQHAASDGGATVSLMKSRGSVGTPAAVTTTDYLGRLTWQAYTGTQYLTVGAMGMHVDPTGTVTSTSVPPIWWLSTSSVGSAVTTDPFAAGSTVALSVRGTQVRVGLPVNLGNTGTNLTWNSTSQGVGVTSSATIPGNTEVHLVSRTSIIAPAPVQAGDLLATERWTAYDAATAAVNVMHVDVSAGTVGTGTIGGVWGLHPSFSGSFQNIAVLHADTSYNVAVGALEGNATGATAGFLWLPNMAGVPTGVASAPGIRYISASVSPIQLDTTNRRLYVGTAGTSSWQPWAQYTGGMATGYLRSTTGTGLWSTTATIPIADVTGGVSTARTLTAGAGMTGGGDLSADRTFDVAAADGTITVNANSIQVGTIQTANIAAAAVTLPKIVSFITDSFPCRDTAGTGDLEVCAVGGGIEFTGGPGIRTSAFTGDVTKTAGGTALTIAADAVDNTKAANMPTARIKGRVTAGTGDPEDLTGTQATTLLDTFTTTLKGLVPPPGSVTGAVLHDDGTWSAASGGTVTTVTATAPIFITGTPATTPNVTIQGAVTTGGTSTSATSLGALGAGVLQQTVSGGVSTPAVFATTAGRVLVGAGTGLTDSANLTYSGGTLTATGTTPLVVGGGGTGAKTALRDPDNNVAYAQLLMYPNSGTNVSESVSVVPRGTGAASDIKGQFTVFNTDYLADTTNYELVAMRTRGTSSAVIATGKGGTGTNRALMLAAGWMTDGSTNANQLLLNTDGTIDAVSLAAGGMVKAAATSGKFQIAAAGADYPSPTAHYITDRAESGLTNEVSLGALSSGLLYHSVSASVSTPAALNGTAGSVVFFSSGGAPAQDNANFFWDNVNKRLGVGSNAPAAGTLVHLRKSVDGGTSLLASNSNGGANAYAWIGTGNSDSFGGGQYVSIHTLGTGYGAGVPGTSKLQAVASSSTQSLVINAYGPQDIVFTTTSSETERFRIKNLGYLVNTPGPSSSGSPNLISVTGAGHTTLAANTEATDVLFALNRTVQFTGAAGAFAAQRAFRVVAPTYAFTSSDTINKAVTLSVSGAPLAGTNASFGEAYALEVESGGTRLQGPLGIHASTLEISDAYLITMKSDPGNDVDRVWLEVGGATANDGQTREWLTLDPLDTSVTTTTVPLIAGMRIRGANYTTGGGGGVSVAAGLYIDQPTIDGAVSGISANAYTLYAGGGTTSQAKFEGSVTARNTTATNELSVGANNAVVSTTGYCFQGAACLSGGVGITTITGSRGGNVALGALLADMAAHGLIIDGTTP